MATDLALLEKNENLPILRGIHQRRSGKVSLLWLNAVCEPAISRQHSKCSNGQVASRLAQKVVVISYRNTAFTLPDVSRMGNC